MAEHFILCIKPKIRKYLHHGSVVVHKNGAYGHCWYLRYQHATKSVRNGCINAHKLKNDLLIRLDAHFASTNEYLRENINFQVLVETIQIMLHSMAGFHDLCIKSIKNAVRP